MPARIESIAQAWEDYRTIAMRRNAGHAQVKECRRAFYAGAESLLAICAQGFDPGDKMTASDIEHVEDLRAELRSFARDMQEGVA